jgi:hypothetical protein
VTVIVRQPAPPLDRLVGAITYQGGEQPRTAVEKILPSAGTGLWVSLNRDEFRSFGWNGRVSQVPGAMLAGPASRASVIEFEQGRVHITVAGRSGGGSPPRSASRPSASPGCSGCSE